jgi:hypothetical protein
VIVFGISIPLALFERWGIAKFGIGWGQPLPADTFWGKPALEHVPWNIVDVRLFTRYHLVMFLIKVPVVSALAVFVLQRSGLLVLTNWSAWLTFMVACVLGVMALEDFLFFVFNSLFGAPYPHALARLLRGEANWHPRWIDFGLFKLPDFYVWMPIVIAFLLITTSWLRR